MDHPVTFTIMTPAFNRAHTLRRAFDSICAQTYRCFEWFVVDDGSTDNTEELIASLSREATFPVRYMYQENGGKHRAHNAALPHLRGKYTVILDSDDELTPTALEILERNWQSVERDHASRIAAILGRSIVGQGWARLSSSQSAEVRRDNYVEGHHFYLHMTGHMVGDLLPCYRTDILQQYPFPEKHGDTSHVMEGTVWIKIGQDFLVRCIESTVRVYHRDPEDANSLMRVSKDRRRHAWGKLQYSLVVVSFFDQYFMSFPLAVVRHCANVTRFSLHCGCLVDHKRQAYGFGARIALAATAPLGVALCIIDQLRPSSRSGNL
jgi:glycosyltransferase involved in cell wall biosynthesis